jgi:tetratricopeptide (TPR) repeat protein
MTSTAADCGVEINALYRRNPCSVLLAESLSLACRIEPELLRAARLLIPGADASAEADLWFSALVESRTADWLVIHPDAALALRARLATRPDRLRVARQLVTEYHQAAPKTVRLEEDILWWSLGRNADEKAIDKALMSVVGKMRVAGSERATLARWFASAALRLPQAARGTQAYAVLSLSVSAILPGRQFGEVRLETPNVVDLLREVFPLDVPTIELFVALTEDGVVIDPTQRGGFQRISTPRSDPIVLRVRRDGGSPELQLVRAGTSITIGCANRVIELHTIAGDVYTLRRRATRNPRKESRAKSRFVTIYAQFSVALLRASDVGEGRVAIAAFGREEGNIRQAVRWAGIAERFETVSTLGYVLECFLEMTGRTREAQAWADRVGELLRYAEFSPAASEWVLQRAGVLVTRGDCRRAVEELRALIERLRSSTEFDPAFQSALAVGSLGKTLQYAGSSSQAIPILEEAVDLWEVLVERAGGVPSQALLATGDHGKAAPELGNLSAGMGNLANALRDSGHLGAALEIAERGLRIQSARGNVREVAVAHGIAASILVTAGRHDEAEARYDLALAAARQAGDGSVEATTLQHQGAHAIYRRQFVRAASLCGQALRRSQDAGDAHRMMQAMNLLGVLGRNEGRLTEARAWYEASSRLAVNLKDEPGQGQAAQNLGIVCQFEGDAARARGDEPAARSCFQAAFRSVEESLLIWQAQKNQPYEAASLSQLGIIHLRLGDLAAAEQYANAARQIRESLGLPELWRSYGVLSEIAEARGDTAAAAEWAQKRDAKRAELERLAGGGGGLSSQMVKALQQLAIACAQAGFGQAQPQGLGPDVEEALAKLDQFPAPFPEFAAFLRHLAVGQLPPIPASLSAELRTFVEQLAQAIRKARGG